MRLARHGSYATALLLTLGAVRLGAQTVRPSATQATTPGYRISGTMRDSAEGRKLAGAVVTILQVGGVGASLRTTTGNDGRFLFEGLSAGKYRLSARKRGLASRQYKEHEEFSAAIAVGPGRTAEDIQFSLPRGAVISGVVRDEANDPVRDTLVKLLRAGVSAGRSEAAEISQTTTNDEGRYHFAQLEPGEYLVSVKAEPWYANHRLPRWNKALDGGASEAGQVPETSVNADYAARDVTYAVMYFPNAASKAEATPIHVAWGESADADFNLQPVPAIHLSVRTAVGEPVNVMRHDGGFAERIEGRTLAEGSTIWYVGGLTPGQVTITFFPPGENAQRRSRVVELSGSAQLDERSLPPGVSMEGVVKMADHAALPERTEIILESTQANEVVASQAVGAGGTFRFQDGSLEPGTYKVGVYGANEAVVVGVSASEATVDGDKVTIGAERDVKLAVTIAQGTSHVNGVAMHDARPLEGIMMLLVPLDFGGPAGLYRRDESDSDGTFEFEGVVPGNYLGVGIEEGWDLGWGKAEVLGKYLARGTKVVVGKDGVSNVKVEVQ